MYFYAQKLRICLHLLKKLKNFAFQVVSDRAFSQFVIAIFLVVNGMCLNPNEYFNVLLVAAVETLGNNRLPDTLQSSRFENICK